MKHFALCLLQTVLMLAPASGVADDRPSGNYILNLYDAMGPDIEGVTQDFGFSALISWEGQLILFDAGTNADVLKGNAAALGVDLAEVDFAVASHSHFDHINGFDYLLEVNPEVKIYFPQDPFFGAPFPFDATGMDPTAAAGLPLDQQYFRGGETKFTFDQSGRFWGSDVEYVAESREIAPGIHLVATRSPYMGYFTRYPGSSVEMDDTDSEVKTMGLPELSLSLKSNQGEILIVGCSHSLVETIVSESRSYLGVEKIRLVMGGFHLIPYDGEEIVGMALRMKDDLGVESVAPAHCTGHLGFKVFSEVFGDDYHRAGLGSYVDLK